MSAISLVLLVFNAWLAVLLCNAEKGTMIASTRVDAEQDPFQSVTVDATNVGPTSVLFDSCLAASLTISAKFYSIVAGLNSVEFLRYVPDSIMTVNVPWKALNVNGSILTCADAAADAGYPMFTYNGTACLVANNSYDTTVTPACDANQTNAVFINPAANLTCKYPYLLLTSGTCLRVLPTPSYTYSTAIATCPKGLFRNINNDYDLVVATLNLKGYTSTGLIVDSGGSSSSGYLWWKNASYFENASDMSLTAILYMNPASNFLLKAETNMNAYYGLLCLG